MHEWIKEKPEKIVAKLKNEYGNFKKSVIIPTDYYPLNKDEFKVFHCNNTKKVVDEALLMTINKAEYKIGHCYRNTENIVHLLKEAGYDVKSYVGWLFVAETQFPVHHCWAVVDDIYVIDLSDDFTMMFSAENYKNFVGLNVMETRVAMLEFALEARKQPHSVRCSPVGKPSPMLYYIGCECEPEDGKRIYNELIKKYPVHECQRNCDTNGLNPTQKLFEKHGLT